jgi:NAD+ kinase
LKAGVISRIDKRESVKVAKDLVELLESKGVDVQVETDTALAMEMPGNSTDLGDLDVDFIVTIGGDGMILRTAMFMKEPETPILGVNMGSRGFLTEIYPNQIKSYIDRVMEGDYILEECVKLSSRSSDIQGIFPDALNEVLVASSLPSKALDMSIKIDEEQILDIQADGAMVATPTGSTAYNLSAGGSILSPHVEAMIITTICPYSYFRSIVTPLSNHITIKLLKSNVDALLIIDGREYRAIKPESTIEVWASDRKARFIRFKSFYSRLERRLVFHELKYR